MSFSVATWNAEWATPGGRGSRISAILDTVAADLIVLTEGVRDLLPEGGFAVDAGDDWGYGRQPSRRKVLVWSRFPLACEVLGEAGATRGRLAVTVVQTPEGPLRVVGVCIPWRDAHVNTGGGDARPWSEHVDYLDRLEQLLVRFDDGTPTVIAGDYNQRVPLGRQPVAVAGRLRQVLASWTIHTAGALPHGPHIDHIATYRRLVLDAVRDWPASDDLGRLSDHAGVVCRLSFAESSVLVSRTENYSPLAPSITESDSAWLPQPTLHKDPEPRKDCTAMYDNPPPPQGSLDPELRAEIEDILRRSGEGLSHGRTFRLRERGLSAPEIAAECDRAIGTIRVWLRSIDAMLTGVPPTSRTAAEDNSYGYRELLNHSLSDKLASHTRAQLRKLKAINPEVSFEPLNTRAYPYGGGKRKPKPERPASDACPECAAIGIIHSGGCWA